MDQSCRPIVKENAQSCRPGVGPYGLITWLWVIAFSCFSSAPLMFFILSYLSLPPYLHLSTPNHSSCICLFLIYCIQLCLYSCVYTGLCLILSFLSLHLIFLHVLSFNRSSHIHQCLVSHPLPIFHIYFCHRCWRCITFHVIILLYRKFYWKFTLQN